jgi:ABC-type nitrate/sulfonate/bicarbonate transport system ATPase subunit
MYPCQLSGGQRQRIAIIQQLLCSTHFIIMDEPFSGLDPIAKDDVCHVLNEISLMDELNTIIVITHDISCAIAISDTVLMLGRDKDAAGNKLQGARIQTSFDLAERDLAWHKDVEHQPNFRQTLTEITSTFFTL